MSYPQEAVDGTRAFAPQQVDQHVSDGRPRDVECLRGTDSELDQRDCGQHLCTRMLLRAKQLLEDRRVLFSRDSELTAQLLNVAVVGLIVSCQDPLQVAFERPCVGLQLEALLG